MNLRAFAISTVLGIAPGAFVFASLGAGLGKVFEMGGEITLAKAFTPEVTAALAGLTILALAPVAYRRVRSIAK